MSRVVIAAFVGAGIALGIVAVLPSASVRAPSSEDSWAFGRAARERFRAVAKASLLSPEGEGALKLIHHSEHESGDTVAFSDLWTSDARSAPDRPFPIRYDGMTCHARFAVSDSVISLRQVLVATLNLAHLYDAELAQADLHPYSSKWWSDDRVARLDAVTIRFETKVQAQATMGKVGHMWGEGLSRASQHIQASRHYTSLKTGAALCIHMDLRLDARELDVRFIYFDRTVCGVPYPDGTIEFMESLD